MTITLELKPELEQRVKAEAAAHGVSLEEYLLAIIAGSTSAQGATRFAPEEATLEQFEAAMDLFSEGSEALPVLPPEAFSRESIYEGR